MKLDRASSTTKQETLLKAAHTMLEQAHSSGTVVYVVVRDRDIWNASKPIHLPAEEGQEAIHGLHLEIQPGPDREDRDIWNGSIPFTILPPLPKWSRSDKGEEDDRETRSKS